ncbi:MAG: hypothetical protein ACMVY4_10595 [Minwuia sp.]|uniref:hypothetical protein n=1 Tax=Minwuia sp. TaxID=2493630 RepID=UPI003A888E72
MAIRRFITGLALAAAAAMPLAAPSSAKVATTDENLEATIQIERRVRLAQGGATSRIHVNVALRNTGTEELTITAPGQCAIHNYAIVLPNNDPVIVNAKKECGGGEVQVTIPPGGQIQEGATMQVRGGELEAGRRYYVIYEFWGVRIRSPFRILEDQ